jgi:hypothetical protein
MKIVCIDPGTPFGFSVWEGQKFIRAEKRMQPGRKTWNERSKDAANQLHSMLKATQPDVVYCEVPAYFEGHAAAAKGVLVKLCRTVGRFEQVCDDLGIEWVDVEVKDWLGQLDARAIRHRAEGVLGKEFCDRYTDEHSLDAICIGLHVHGRWPM